MKLSIRDVRESEWPICRMLLPETFDDVAGRSYLICVQDEAPRVVGAASFRRTSGGIAQLRVQVVPRFRRQGAGSGMLEHIARLGANVLSGVAEVAKDPGIDIFCERNLFQRTDALTTVEADMSEMREYMNRLRRRLSSAPGARVVSFSAAPVDQVARLHAQHVAQEGELNQWRRLVARSHEMDISPVVMVEGGVAGILLGHVDGETAVVRSRVVAPGYQGSWVNAVLIAEALDIGWAAGARRARFSYTSSNRDTEKLARRFRAKVTSVVAQFTRPAAGYAE